MATESRTKGDKFLFDENGVSFAKEEILVGVSFSKEEKFLDRASPDKHPSETFFFVG
jgi:hypothetical protein